MMIQALLFIEQIEFINLKISNFQYKFLKKIFSNRSISNF